MLSNTQSREIAVVGMDVGKNSFHVVGLDQRGAIVLRQKWSAWPSGSTIGQYAALLDRHGGVCWYASSQSENQGASSQCTADAGQIRTALLEGTEE